MVRTRLWAFALGSTKVARVRWWDLVTPFTFQQRLKKWSKLSRITSGNMGGGLKYIIIVCANVIPYCLFKIKKMYRLTGDMGGGGHILAFTNLSYLNVYYVPLDRTTAYSVYCPETYEGYWRQLTVRTTRTNQVMAMVFFNPQVH